MEGTTKDNEECLFKWSLCCIQYNYDLLWGGGTGNLDPQHTLKEYKLMLYYLYSNEYVLLVFTEESQIPCYDPAYLHLELSLLLAPIYLHPI